MKEISECTCTRETPGDCREREVATLTIRLSDQHLRDSDWGGGFFGMFEAAAHEWFDWEFPGHDEVQCWEFYENTSIKPHGDGWRLWVFDLDDRLWQFEIGPLEPDDFAPEEGNE